MNREEIKNIMPHREPMLLLDEVFVDEDNYAVGSYTVRGDEFFLMGHFPNNPVVPGVILCEIMAQTACILFADKNAFTPLYTGLNNVKFRNPVKPGDTVTTRCKIVKSRHYFHFAEGTVMVGDKLCVSAEFSFALIAPEK